MGIAISVDELQKMQKSIPHLVNVSADPLMSEALLYPCKEGMTRIGSKEKDPEEENTFEATAAMRQDIQLTGLKIRDEHAVLTNHDHHCELRVLDSAQCMVNGIEVTSNDKPLTLCHGDWYVQIQPKKNRFSARSTCINQ